MRRKARRKLSVVFSKAKCSQYAWNCIIDTRPILYCWFLTDDCTGSIHNANLSSGQVHSTYFKFTKISARHPRKLFCSKQFLFLCRPSSSTAFFGGHLAFRVKSSKPNTRRKNWIEGQFLPNLQMFVFVPRSFEVQTKAQHKSEILTCSLFCPWRRNAILNTAQSPFNLQTCLDKMLFSKRKFRNCNTFWG